jgi:hypothetical protein
MQRTGTFASIDLSQMFIFIILENDLIEVDHLISFNNTTYDLNLK